MKGHPGSWSIQRPRYYLQGEREKKRIQLGNVGMLDKKAAFDVVWHHVLFAKLGRQGFVGKIIRTIILSYSNLSCLIKINGRLSVQIGKERYVRQGWVPST